MPLLSLVLITETYCLHNIKIIFHGEHWSVFFSAVACITDIKDLSQASFIQCCLGMILLQWKCRITKIIKSNHRERIFAVIINDKVLLYGWKTSFGSSNLTCTPTLYSIVTYSLSIVAEKKFLAVRLSFTDYYYSALHKVTSVSMCFEEKGIHSFCTFMSSK